jgi:hypothetical protein
MGIFDLIIKLLVILSSAKHLILHPQTALDEIKIYSYQRLHLSPTPKTKNSLLLRNEAPDSSSSNSSRCSNDLHQSTAFTCQQSSKQKTSFLVMLSFAKHLILHPQTTFDEIKFYSYQPSKLLRHPQNKKLFLCHPERSEGPD